jgi:acetoacetyl-CoA synthetase
MAVGTEPAVVWTPAADAMERTEIGRFLRWLRERRGLEFESYDTLWQWSVDDLDGFWSSIWDFFGVRSHAPSGSRAR